MRMLVAALVLVAVGATLPQPAAADSGSEGDPESYRCLIYPHPGNPMMEVLSDIECGMGATLWELGWYYPPVVYQAWCFATGDCPCPHCPSESASARA